MTLSRRHHTTPFIALTVAAILMSVGLLIAAGPGRAQAATGTATISGAFAPISRPGPALDVPAASLAASLQCEPSVTHAAVEPVLLSPASGTTPAQDYGWNWELLLTKLGIPWCAYTPPEHTLGEMATSGEYLVYAIRTEYALAGRPIAIMGHSQGGMTMRWALRFWPDTRPMVADVIGFSGPNHGSTTISAAACAQGCAPAAIEQIPGSPFLSALNSYAETFPGISYTEIWTHDDETVQPDGDAATASAALHTGGGQITNVAVQDICPGDHSDHILLGTDDNVAYSLAVDALTHPGPADPTRIPKTVCNQLTTPGVSLLSPQAAALAGALPGLLGFEFGAAAAADGVATDTTQPPLPCYVYAACPAATTPAPAPKKHHKTRHKKPRHPACPAGKVHSGRRCSLGR